MMCCGEEKCCEGLCARCHAGKKLFLGALVLLNIFVWPKWTGSFNSWVAFFAVLLVIGSAVKLVKPTCSHCKAEAPARKGK